ncbi:MAG: glutamine amidotransferase [Cyclobacteriaceae bacterium]|nr:glutamine amidotransferase [Cyclobacteriaceae bacterium]
MKKTCYLFIFPGFSDWEASYATVGISLSDRYEVKTIAIQKTMVKSLGGMSVLPDYDFIPEVDLKDINSFNTGIVILPGGTAWEKGSNKEIEPLVRHCLENGIPVAAICGATVFLADHHWLNDRAHTSNDLGYLHAMSSSYRGHDFYLEKLSVRNGNLITANGTAPVEFAKDIFGVLGINNEESVKEWFQYFEKAVVQ